MNPNFEKNYSGEVKAKLDDWFGEKKYVPMIVWEQDGTYFAVVQNYDIDGRPVINMARLFKIGDKLEISIDEQKEVV